ncbi:MAG: hypothetical protein WAM14_19890 [Candidatus Nitrosopolaris sp.]
MIDTALLRPGRFDKIVYVPKPDVNTRQKIFEIQKPLFGLVQLLREKRESIRERCNTCTRHLTLKMLRGNFEDGE